MTEQADIGAAVAEAVAAGAQTLEDIDTALAATQERIDAAQVAWTEAKAEQVALLRRRQAAGMEQGRRVAIAGSLTRECAAPVACRSLTRAEVQGG